MSSIQWTSNSDFYDGSYPNLNIGSNSVYPTKDTSSDISVKIKFQLKPAKSWDDFLERWDYTNVESKHRHINIGNSYPYSSSNTISHDNTSNNNWLTSKTYTLSVSSGNTYDIKHQGGDSYEGDVDTKGGIRITDDKGNTISSKYGLSTDTTTSDSITYDESYWPYYSSATFTSDTRTFGSSVSYSTLDVDSNIDWDAGLSITVYNTNGDSVSQTLSGGTESVDISSLGASDSVYFTADFTSSSNNDKATLQSVTVNAAEKPSVPQNLSKTVSEDDVTLDWDSVNWNGNQGHYDIKRGTSSGSYTEITTVNSGTTTYTDSGLNDGEKYYYVVEADNSAGDSGNSNEASATTSLPAPSGVTATVQSNDQIDVSWTENHDNGEVHIKMSRDGSSFIYPSGGSGPGSVSLGTTSATYTADNDTNYNGFVGIDSSFQFRVRAETNDTESSWVTSSTVYTEPIPPHNPSVSRSNNNSISFSWINQSDIEGGVEIQYREDTGSGYGSWTTATTTTAGSTSYSNTTLPDDVRRQYRLRTTTSDGGASEWVYADYGNSGNVYFEDDFESGDASAWDNTNFPSASNGSSGVKSTLDSRFANTSPEEGSYAVELMDGGHVEKSLGDLSSESDVHVRLTAQVASWDTDGDTAVKLKWYDGSTWQILSPTYDWEMNQQGWVEIHADVPDSYLSTDNRLRITQVFEGGYAFTAYDRVVVSDVLHEYTEPATPTSLSLDTTVEDEITVNWTDNANFNYKQEIFWSDDGGSTWNQETYWSSDGESYSITGLKDGEKYTVHVRTVISQPRHGSINNWWYKDSPTTTGITVLPAPSQLSADQIAGKSVDLSWVNHHNNGSVKVQYKKSGNSTWNDFSTGLDVSTTTEEITGLDMQTQYDARIVVSTEHESFEDILVSNGEALTFQSSYTVDSDNTIRGSMTIQE